MKTKEKTVDYKTEEITKTYIACTYCGEDVQTEDAHPVDAAGNEIAFCTECFKSVFDCSPHTTIDSVSSGDEFTVRMFLSMIVGGMKQDAKQLVEDYQDGYVSTPDLFFFAVMILALFIAVLFLVGLLLTAILRAIPVPI
jgi:hypothetical protein